jgi:hypothetical protein
MLLLFSRNEDRLADHDFFFQTRLPGTTATTEVPLLVLLVTIMMSLAAALLPPAATTTGLSTQELQMPSLHD